MGKSPRLWIWVGLGSAPFWHPGSSGLVEYVASAAQACHLVVAQAKTRVLQTDCRMGLFILREEPQAWGADLLTRGGLILPCIPSWPPSRLQHLKPLWSAVPSTDGKPASCPAPLSPHRGQCHTDSPESQ